MKLPKLKFSIGFMLLATATAALFPAYYHANSRASELAKQNERLKQDSGYIEANDPSRMYIRELRCPLEGCWRFRINSPTEVMFIKAATFTENVPTADNTTLADTEHIILPRDSVLNFRLVEEDGLLIFRINSVYHHGRSRLRLSVPVHVDLANKLQGSDHIRKVVGMIRDSPSTHGEVRSHTFGDFIPLLTLDGEGPDAGKKVVVYLELQKPRGFLKER